MTSTNNVFTLRACSRVVSAKPSHRAYAAQGKGSAGPVRRFRENGTLGNRPCKDWASMPGFARDGR
ncbi:MAG: hypothetical protein PHC69_05300 [Ruminiclostridium sp.]|nr:hypothetical protein [Ruminiclostridium sp.]